MPSLISRRLPDQRGVGSSYLFSIGMLLRAPVKPDVVGPPTPFVGIPYVVLGRESLWFRGLGVALGRGGCWDDAEEAAVKNSLGSVGGGAEVSS